ncbi:MULTISPECIES: hypothetical protein [unclassified Luteimonas]|uniref:hypothetical protein n=1 Tax=unclassified Luteimonas TaxID=2629088 RepID=UPI0018F0D036|nr:MULTISPECIES: hypothetical protein [unclassified Luteimonas]MBJ6982351.1 hypothetical protein [Luteimonas sp. MC1572]MBJ7575074.1 hypothetical protein [Luteimonas sp. MC1828]QQO03618.1 hypothetical protein JGR64_02275 [Luteimonas sp. MC1572]
MTRLLASAAIAVALLAAPALAQAQARGQVPAKSQAASDLARLESRLHAIEIDPARNTLASYERLQARQALDALAAARSGQARTDAHQVAEWRVETAEIAAANAVDRRELDRLERERSELLVEASRQDAARARAEAERLRIQAQVQAEEAERLRLAAEEESSARQQVEGVLDDVAGAQAAKLRAARQREAELKRQEAELMRDVPGPARRPH